MTLYKGCLECGILTAVVALPDEVVAQAIKLGHIRIGWVSCRICGRAEQLRFFRCWSPGHIAARCKGPDRTGPCYCCAKEVHQAKDCKAPPTCVFCRGQGSDDHTSGGPRCPRAGETL
uniref:CCHC-type domain-containing protein n=1 Tax=Trichogramma kaykai TaxID=54128 RepID=A0ABD2WQJ6_9HYME